MRWDQALDSSINRSGSLRTERGIFISVLWGGVVVSSIGLLAGWLYVNQVLPGPLTFFSMFVTSIALWRIRKATMSLCIVATMLFLWLFRILAPTPWSIIFELGGGTEVTRSIEMDLSSLALIVPLGAVIIMYLRSDERVMS
jgi:hypothetical protein